MLVPSPVSTPLTGPCVRCPHLGVGDGQGVDPDPPAAPLVLDGVVEKDPEDVVNHLGDLLLLGVLGVDVSQREHPVLPHGALQQAAASGGEGGGCGGDTLGCIRLGLPSLSTTGIKQRARLAASCSPSVLAAVAEEFDHVGEEESPDFHELGAGRGVLQQGGDHF